MATFLAQTQLLSITLSHSQSQRRSSQISRHFQPRLFHDHPSTPQPPRLFDVDDQQNDQTPSSDSSNPQSISAQNHRPDIIRVSNDGGENRMKGFAGTKNVIRPWLPEQKQDGPVGLNGVTHDFDSRIALSMSGKFGVEVARVLGGGIVPGSLILIGGDPGVGKNTLSLQISASIAESCDVGGAAPVLYISGEEDILRKIQFLSSCAVVIDSIQTGYLKGVTGCPGGLVQVAECAAALNHFSKETNIPVILIGHVTKSGRIAGPHVFHIVDVVLYMEVPKTEKRMYTLARLGYKKCIVPKTAEKALQSLSSSDMRKMKIVGCSNLEQVMDEVFLT